MPASIREIVARAWKAAFGEASLASGKSFLVHGGDSLQAMLLCSHLGQQLGAPIPLRLAFEHPCLDDFARQVEIITSRGHPAPSVPGATTATGALALSFSQERMLVMHELSQGTAAYHVAAAWELDGPLQTNAFVQAFGEAAARHDALQMAFVEEEGVFQPRFGQGAPPVLEITRLEPVEELEAWLQAFANQPFVLDQGPLLRAHLIALAPDRHLLAVVAHEIVFDLWGLAVFMQDFARHYEALLAGTPADPAPAPSFARFAAAHREWFEHERAHIESAWWLEQTRGSELTALYEDYTRPPAQSFAGAIVRQDLDETRFEALQALAASQGCSVNMVLLAALNVLLLRHTGNDDILVGVSTTNREHPASWEAAGTLVNTVALRAALDGEMSFAALLAQVRERMLDALEHQSLPFDRLVRDLNQQRDASLPALFSVMFNPQDLPLPAVQFGGLHCRPFDFDRKAAQFDLSVTVSTRTSRSVAFEYATALFTEDTARDLLDQYLLILDHVTRDPGCKLGMIPMVDAAGQQRLDALAHGPTAPPVTGMLDDYLWHSLEAHGPATAITCAGESLTFAQLRESAEKLAAGLLARGVGRGRVVGVCLDRSPRMIIALLGVLRTGAAYVPLDPHFPQDRISFMMRDADLALIITDEENTTVVEEDLRGRVAAFDTLLAVSPPAVALPPEPTRRTPGDIAYILYTSGSTGKPKGVVIPHGAVVNLLRSMAVTPGLGPEDRMLVVTTLSFDMSVPDVYLPVATGAQMVIAQRQEQVDGDALLELLSRHRITAMQGTPSTWRMLIDCGWQGTPGLRILIGGEPLPRDLASQLLGRCGELWNMYGPTETTVWSTCEQVRLKDNERISIGRPITNTEVRILDAHQNPCPVGMAGEICIAGDGVAIGYFNRPELTAEKFIGTRPRIYRTGDRGRWQHDGKLEHLGREDSQVKIRGHRIELGEIETRLGAHPDIHSVVVLPWSEAGLEPVLAAWVVTHGTFPGDLALRQHLQQWLPDYMLPQYFTEIPSMPLLPNRKVDRRALPKPSAQEQAAADVTPPSTDLEQALWDIWADVLQRRDFGTHESLFDLGGHSLIAVRLAGRIRTELERPCNLAMLLRHTSIAALAKALDDSHSPDETLLIPLQVQGTGPELFCICGIMIYKELATALAPAYRACGIFVPREMEFLAEHGGAAHEYPGVPELAREYLQAIRLRQPRGPYHLLGFSFGGILAYEVAQQLLTIGERVELLVLLDSELPGGNAPTRIRTRLKEGIKRLLGRDGPGGEDPLTALRNARYTDAAKRYTASPYPGQVLYVSALQFADAGTVAGWKKLAPRLRALEVDDHHLGVLTGTSGREVAAFVHKAQEEEVPAT